MIHHRLKMATSFQHEAMQRDVDIPSMLKKQGTYRCFLRAALGFHEPLEQRIEVFAAHELLVTLEWAAHRKAAWLRADLLALGDTPGALAGLPRAEKLPGLASPAEVLGCLYVLEGAMLGGQVMSRLLHRNLGLSPAGGGRYFHGYGAQTPARWRSLLAALERVGTGGSDGARVEAAAVATFATYHDWLLQTCRARESGVG